MAMRSKGLFLAAMAMSLMGEDLTNSNLKEVNEGTKEKEVIYDEPPIAEGFERYYFNNYGECPKGQHIVYFDAMKKCYAYVKFQRWIQNKGE